MRRIGAVMSMLALVGACRGTGTRPPDYRGYTDHFSILVWADPSPPRARQRVTYKVVVRDKDSRQPVEGGEGQIFANTEDMTGRTWDSFVAGPAPGEYYANLNFVVATNWAMAIRFRRDSTQKLERIDWMQQVNAPGNDPE